MTNFTVADSHFTYEITTNSGRPANIVRRAHDALTGEQVEYDELPFLVQTKIEAALNNQFEDVPKQLFVK